MTKTYLTKWTPSKKPGEEHKSDLWFDPDPEKAAHWPTKEAAAFDCEALKVMNVEVTTPDGAKHRCTGFEVEERTPDRFVVFCTLL
jgi:hypothetical protein